MGMNVVPERVAAVIKELVRLESARQRQIMLFRCVCSLLRKHDTYINPLPSIHCAGVLHG
jgi:hypothetical protein